ncbi:MAG: HEAT repeat domain-containing protein [Verrucomicrobiota bacterium]|nr:HEAT repeat domain-containing protein [Verrucomicrobiota bacterium]
MLQKYIHITISLISSTTLITAETKLLDDQFELPQGFHIYRAAEPNLTGGSYDLTFDAQGRLLVAEGNSLRRIVDADKNGIYDSQETIAAGAPLRGRGPQGLLVMDDHLYTVSGDGVQLFSGYKSKATLKYERRLGAPFNTGGDHAAHTILRGLDGYIYLVSGDGGGIGARKHITQENSPVREERTASVFRFDPKGEKWECIGSGGRNPPSLGMNYLGEFFSFDSDMEFHVDVPFYRPVRLNHWATGGDHGWQGVGAYPPYYVDCLPGVLEVGRGSPNWGVFYEHSQFPKKYHDGFIVCDYRWKSATTGRYASSGRLVVFHLKRFGGTWKAEMTELVKAKPGAKDKNGRPINFALVDVDVAPDGSLMVTDHSQGVWRIFYDSAEYPKVPPIVPKWSIPKSELLSELLRLPQKGSEWSRARQIAIKNHSTFNVTKGLMDAALDKTLPGRSRLNAIRLLSPQFQTLPYDFIKQLANSPDEEVRGQAAWLIGIRGKSEHEIIIKLLDDPNPFVRRRASEAMLRIPSPIADGPLVQQLDDDDRFVRYSAMLALSHRPTSEYFGLSSKITSPRVLIRLLVAPHLRKELPPANEAIAVIERLLHSPNLNSEDQIDLLRVLAIYRKQVKEDVECLKLATAHLTNKFPHADQRVRWEQVRVMGAYKISQSFAQLVEELLEEKDYITQFHIATSLADLPLTDSQKKSNYSEKLADWMVSNQNGWFAEFSGKGLQFPSFWGTVLNKLCGLHADILVAKLGEIKPDSLLSKNVLSKIDSVSNADQILIDHYKRAGDRATRQNIINILQRTPTAKADKFMLKQLSITQNRELRRALTLALAKNAGEVMPGFFLSALFEFDDAETINACALGLAMLNKTLDQIRWKPAKPIAGRTGAKAVHYRFLELMEFHPASATQLEFALSVLSGHKPIREKIDPLVIWSSAAQDNGDMAWFAREFNVSNGLAKAELVITCDNEFVAYVNGKLIAKSKTWERPLRVDVTAHLRVGKNLITVEGKNLGGPAGLIARLVWENTRGESSQLVSDQRWLFTRSPQGDWQKNGSIRGNWEFSHDVSESSTNVINTYHAFTNTKDSNQPIFIQQYWHKWYLNRHGEAFVARDVAKATQRSDEVIHKLISSKKHIQGNISQGRAMYLKAGCYACHGGIDDRKTTIFGPPLNGATLRLKRKELADAIVYPSKHVAERFKASMLITKNGNRYNGFITEHTEDFVSVTDLQNKITRLPRSEVDSIQLQQTSLMPMKLLNGFSDQQVGDLLAFLKSLK